MLRGPLTTISRLHINCSSTASQSGPGRRWAGAVVQLAAVSLCLSTEAGIPCPSLGQTGRPWNSQAPRDKELPERSSTLLRWPDWSDPGTEVSGTQPIQGKAGPKGEVSNPSVAQRNAGQNPEFL